MKSRMILMVSLFVLAATVVACGEQPVYGRVAGTPTPSTSGGDGRIVTLAEEGKTVALHVGESFLLKLGEDYDWAVAPADQSIVSRVVNIMVVKGAQGVYRAHKVGATTLTATGDPVCRKAKPACGMPSREFRIQVVVQ